MGVRPSTGRPWKQRLHWLFLRKPCFLGLVGALVTFCVSLTPSLLPRSAMLQGVVCGLSGAAGYGFGSAISSVTRKLVRREPSPATKRVAWWTLLALGGVLVPTFLVLGRDWQDEIRASMGIASQPPWQLGTIVIIAVVVAAIVLLISRVIRGLNRVTIRFMDRWAPRAISVPAGIVLATVLVIGLVQGFLLNPTIAALNSAFSLVNDGTSDDVEQPTSALRSGGPDSLIPWDTLGVKGRDFIGEGPTSAEITAITGEEATEPIRVYAGIKSAPTIDERVALILQELDRAEAWDRDVLTVFTATGTGWVDPKSADAVEYIHGGSTALVSLQYSYLPSWISFLVDQQKAADAGQSLISAIQQRWKAMPPNDRPQLFLYGESLGSFGTESAFDNVDEMVAGADGALLVGPVFRNDIHTGLTNQREDGSPAWRPVYRRGENIRFVVEPDDLDNPEEPWAEPRVVYLQNSSDPITYWHPNLIFSKPDWLRGERGPDVSDSIVYLPVVTFLQTAADLAFAAGVPAGHGHKYGANPVDAWVAISQPDGWTDDRTERLRNLIGHD